TQVLTKALMMVSGPGKNRLVDTVAYRPHMASSTTGSPIANRTLDAARLTIVARRDLRAKPRDTLVTGSPPRAPTGATRARAARPTGRRRSPRGREVR